jgi:hypothetical protein
MTPIHPTILSSEKYGNQYRLHNQIGAFRVSGPVRKAEVQEKPLLRLLWDFSHQELAYTGYRKDPGFKAGEAFPLRRTD